MFLDFEKAFDTISWEFLFQTLKHFNFGDNLIKWIKLIYNKPLCCLNNNLYASQFFELTRGVRQGCPISALLFILVAEIMSIKIRENKDIQGLTFNNKEVKLSQLADDTTLFLKDNNSIAKVLELLKHFQNCAGLKLNTDKTEIIKLGQDDHELKVKFGIKWVKAPVKVLGIWVGKNHQEVINKNFENKISKLQRLINMWKSRNLSIKGKITLLRAQALPLILYPSTVLYVPEEVIKELDNIFFDFIWPRKKHHVKKSVLIQNIEDGGLKMPDIQSTLKAMKLSWIKRLCTKNNNFTIIAKTCTRINDFNDFFGYKNDIKFLSPHIPNFYKQICEHWYELHSSPPQTKNDIMNETLWFNKHILVDNKPIFYKLWDQHGISHIYHILNQNGNFKSERELLISFGLNVDTMLYNGVKSAILNNG